VIGCPSESAFILYHAIAVKSRATAGENDNKYRLEIMHIAQVGPPDR